MPAFTFDFDLEGDLDESFDPIPPKPSVPPIYVALALEGTEQPAEEIPQSDLVRTPTSSIDPHHHALQHISPPSQKRSHIHRSRCPRVDRRSYDGTSSTRVSSCWRRGVTSKPRLSTRRQAGVYEGRMKTLECALDLAAYIDREVSRVRGLRHVSLHVLELAVVGCLIVRVVGLWDCGAHPFPFRSPLCVFSV
jgi:hypothetical protein